MTCTECQDKLLELFGSGMPDPAVENHLRSCENCRTFHGELVRLTNGLGSDNDFVPESVDLQQFVTDVQRLTEPKPSIASFPRWRRLALASAAVVLLGMTSLVSYHLGSRKSNALAENRSKGDTAIILELADSDTTGAIDDVTVDLLLYNYTARHSNDAGDILIDDLDENEFRFLETNLKVGGLL